MGPIIFLVVVLIPVGIGFFIAYRKAVAKAAGDSPPTNLASNVPDGERKHGDVRARVAGAQTAQEYLGFETLMGNVIKLDPNRYRAFIEIEPVSYFLMTAGEQDILEAGFRQVLESLRFPVQFYIASVPLDVSEHLNSITRNMESLPVYLQEYGTELAAFTDKFVREVSPITKRYVLIVSYDFAPNARKPVRQEIVEQQAVQDLNNRCQMLVEAFAQAKVGASRMREEEILPFLYQLFNRTPGSMMAARGLVSENLHSLYTTGLGAETDADILRALYGSSTDSGEATKSA